MRGFRVVLTGMALFSLTPAFAQGPRQIAGVASFYDKNYKGKTASGQPYDATKLTAAHKTLPFGTRLVVTDVRTRRTVTVVVNDRGPFSKGRILDLSYAAATALHMQARGLVKVTASVQ